MFPTDTNASREALRRTLNQSLTEVLGDVGFDNSQRFDSSHLQAGGGGNGVSVQQQLASLQAQQAARTPSSFLSAQQQQAAAAATSPLAHSLGFNMPTSTTPSNAAAVAGMAGMATGGGLSSLNDALLASAVAQQQQQQSSGSGGAAVASNNNNNTDIFLGQARAAIMQQRIVELEKKRQLLLEENKRRILEDSYMALLRSGALDKKPHAAALGGVGGMAGMAAAGLADADHFHLPLTALASHITGQQQQLLHQNGVADNHHLASVRQVVQQQQQLQQATSPAAAAAAVLVPRPVAQASKMTNPLQALGSSLRNRDDPYIDVSTLPVPQGPLATSDSSLRRTRGGVAEPFPERLYRMLDTESTSNKDDNKDTVVDHSDIVSFYSHGRGFGVHDPDRFVAEVMPKYFKQSKWNSFARQLNLYGFVRITSGADAGGYYHELFLRGRPDLCLHMRRVGVPHQGADRRKIKYKNAHGGGNNSNSAHTDPDFYSMKPITIPESLLNKTAAANAATSTTTPTPPTAAASASTTPAPASTPSSPSKE